MALSQKQVAEIIKLYDGGDGDDIGALASAYEVTPAAIAYHLKKAGAYNVAKRETDETMSDADLGIGEDDAAATSIADILKNPALAALIDQAVQARLAQIATAPSGEPFASGDTTAVVKAIEHLLEVQSSQMPGYIKPISAAEVDRRAAAHVDLLAQIENAKHRYAATNSKNEVPHYILGSQFFECANAILYEEGQEIRTFIQPSETFVPMNESARVIHAAMITSIGGSSPDIGARVAEAMIASKEVNVPIVGGAASIGTTSPVEIVPASKRHDVRPNRVLGAITPETRGTSMPMQPGITQQPTGPVFVGA